MLKLDDNLNSQKTPLVPDSEVIYEVSIANIL